MNAAGRAWNISVVYRDAAHAWFVNPSFQRMRSRPIMFIYEAAALMSSGHCFVRTLFRHFQRERAPLRPFGSPRIFPIPFPSRFVSPRVFSKCITKIRLEMQSASSNRQRSRKNPWKRLPYTGLRNVEHILFQLVNFRQYNENFFITCVHYKFILRSVTNQGNDKDDFSYFEKRKQSSWTYLTLN